MTTRLVGTANKAPLNRRTPRVGVTVVLALAALSVANVTPLSASDDPDDLLRYAHAPIPTFARLYGTGCSTCHSAAPKLNVLGEAFRLAGYRLPDNTTLLRRDDVVSLGAEPWKSQWPRTIWPSDLPGISPLAARVESDVRVMGQSDGSRDLDFLFPNQVYLLAAAPLGESVSAFLEVNWNPTRGLSVFQAKFAFRDVIPGLPSGSANLSLGKQDPFLFTFTDRQIDRAGVNVFSWQFFQPASLNLTGPGGTSRRSENQHTLGGGLPAVELNGVVAGRLHYGLGVSQGGGSSSADNNDAKDPYYRLRYKWGGLNLLGQYDPGGGPVLGTGGQLQDKALIIEHFGYRGNESTATDPQGSHWSTGINARVLHGPWDAGVGVVRRTFQRPFDTTDGALTGTNWFSKVEYLVFPWLMGSLKYDHLNVAIDPTALPGGFSLDSAARRALAPGAVLLVRQNVRAVVEGRFYLDGDARSAAPNDLYLRLDVIF